MPGRGTVSLLLLALAIAVAAGGCGGSKSAGRATAKPASGPREGPVVSVEAVSGTRRTRSTGVVFEADQGLVLTAGHAVENAESIDVRVGGGSVSHAREIASAPCHDLALLKLFPTPLGLRALPLADSASARVGEPVTTLTYLLPSARGERLVLSRVPGAIAAVGVSETFPPLPPAGPFIAHATALVPSASGSPIVDARGRMIGINTLVGYPRRPAVRGVEHALSSNYIRLRLRQLRPGSRGALAGWGRERETCRGAVAPSP